MSARRRSRPRRSRKFYLFLVLSLLIGIAISGGLMWYAFPKEVHLYVFGPASSGSATVKIWFNGKQIFEKSYPRSDFLSPLEPADNDYIKASTVETDFTVRATYLAKDETRTFSILRGNVIDISFDSSIILIVQSKTMRS